MTEEIKKLQEESTDVVTQAKEINIASQTDYDDAGKFGKEIVKALKKKISDTFDPSINNAHKTWKGMIAERDKHLAPLEKAESLIKDKMLAYYKEEERKRKEEERKREEAAKKEEDRKRKEKEEQERKWREKEEAAQKEADRLAAEGKEDEARKAQEIADKAAEKAEERKEEAENVYVAPEAVQTQAPVSKGTAVKENWDFAITNERVLITALLDNPMLSDLVTVDEKELRKAVKSMKSKLKLPGLRVWNKGTVAI